MLNIISRSLVSSHTRGPKKVVHNLLKGLDELGHPYVINAALDATDTLWIHDDKAALEAALALPGKRAIVAGPNIYTLPSEIPDSLNISGVIWLHPAAWVQDFWNTFSVKKIPSVVWPVGIDTETFSPQNVDTRELVLVYNKQRSNSDVEIICQALEARSEHFAVLTYGKYHEEEYRTLLAQAKAIIWIGRSESQGIGLLEALAMNVPALVWDIQHFGQWSGDGHDRFNEEQLAFPLATAAPYFDTNCGVIFSEKTELDSSLSQFLANVPTFSPRKYVENNLSLAKQANDFLAIYKTHFNLTDDTLRDTTVTTTKKWKNASWYFCVSTQLKDAIRRIIR